MFSDGTVTLHASYTTNKALQPEFIGTMLIVSTVVGSARKSTKHHRQGIRIKIRHESIGLVFDVPIWGCVKGACFGLGGDRTVICVSSWTVSCSEASRGLRESVV